MEINKEAVLKDSQKEISELCEIDLDDLGLCLKQHPILYGRAYDYYEKAKASVSSQKWKYEQAKTKAFSELRDGGMAIGAAKERAEVEPEVIDAYNKLLEAEKRAGIFHALVRGLDHRKDMLIQLSSREKKEYGAY